MKTTVKNYVTVALLAALLAVLSPFSLQIGPIPLTLATLGVYFCAALLGEKRGTLAVAVYLLLGAVGVPVFAGFSGGVQKFAGPTGGYLVGYLLCAFLAGLFIRRHAEKPLFWIVGFVVGTAALYAFGTAWFMIGSKTPFGAALLTCVVTFLVGDAVKIAAAIAIGFPLRKTLSRHHYI